MKLSRKESALIMSLCSMIVAALGFGVQTDKTITQPTRPTSTSPTTQATLPAPSIPAIFPASTTRGIPQVTASTTTALVKRIVDGDTIELSTGEKVRYIGIDTPELHARDGSGVQCYAGEAAQRNVELVFQKEVTLVADKTNTDKYGRLLRYVYVGDTFVNATLAAEGFAYAKQYKPNITKHAELEAAMHTAQTAKRGIWGSCEKQ
jgi:micrococcal nuclease